MEGGFCQQEELKRCTDPLKILTNNRDLGFATTEKELGKLCPDLLDGLQCIDNFTRRCLDSTHRDFFHMLYAGTKQVIVDLCEDQHYQQEYLDHAPCMRVVQTGYEQCAMDYQSQMHGEDVSGGAVATFDMTEHSGDLCCSFKQYLNCSHSVVKRKCGDQTAKFTSGFLNTMAGPLIQGYCLNYQPGACDTAEEAFPRSDVSDASSGVQTTTTASVQFSQNSASVQFTRSSATRHLASAFLLALPVMIL